jgi:osmotically-inducible protein OsmY
MHDRWDREERAERNRGEFSGHANLGGNWARDPHANREGMGDDYARDAGWSGGGRHDQYTRDNDHRGRGPKNWTADERLRATVNHRLTEHEGIDASDMEVSVANGEVTLSGACRNRSEKRLAEDVTWDCGVRDVHNRLIVAPMIGKASE